MNPTIATDPAIEIVGLTKQYKDEVAVDNLSLSIERGSTFGLIGPNGAGKSTIIKMLMGILTPTKGSMRILGNDVELQPLQVKQRVGYVPDSHYMDRWMKVSEVIGYSRNAFAVWNDELCNNMLDLFDLNPKRRSSSYPRAC